MFATDVAIVGGGQAGLAMSRHLSWRGIDHVVLERGRVGQRWNDAAWDSLRLLTPNWLNALPGRPHDGGDPDGFMSRDEFVTILRDYAGGAPVLERTPVAAVERACGGWTLATDSGSWRARAVVIATGECDLPQVPRIAEGLPGEVASLHASSYRRPGELPEGAVIVVGASSSGVQIADELRRAGRAVFLSVGRHTRLPRTWRGEDIFRWLQRSGRLARPAHLLGDPQAARRQPSLQLAGRPDRSSVDLATLQEIGVRLAGRMVAAEGGSVAFADDLAASVTAAEAKQQRLLAEFDALVGISTPPPPLAAVDLTRPAPRRLSLSRAGVRTVVWATGFSRAFPWLRVTALGADGEIAHRGGVTAFPGLYALGFRLLRKRDSNFIGGVGADAAFLSDHIAGFLGQRGHRAA